MELTVYLPHLMSKPKRELNLLRVETPTLSTEDASTNSGGSFRSLGLLPVAVDFGAGFVALTSGLAFTFTFGSGFGSGFLGAFGFGFDFSFPNLGRTMFVFWLVGVVVCIRFILFIFCNCYDSTV